MQAWETFQKEQQQENEARERAEREAREQKQAQEQAKLEAAAREAQAQEQDKLGGLFGGSWGPIGVFEVGGLSGSYQQYDLRLYGVLRFQGIVYEPL